MLWTETAAASHPQRRDQRAATEWGAANGGEGGGSSGPESACRQIQLDHFKTIGGYPYYY